jgi:hypothetical protein
LVAEPLKQPLASARWQQQQIQIRSEALVNRNRDSDSPNSLVALYSPLLVSTNQTFYTKNTSINIFYSIF